MRPAVFVDTSGYVALLSENDKRHRDASAIIGELVQKQATLFTTNFVVAETHATLLRYVGDEGARSFLREILSGSPGTVIVRAEEDDERAASEIIFRYIDKDFSMVDAISFVVMERMGIKQAFTFDKHFAQYGFDVLRA